MGPLVRAPARFVIEPDSWGLRIVNGPDCASSQEHGWDCTRRQRARRSLETSPDVHLMSHTKPGCRSPLDPATRTRQRCCPPWCIDPQINIESGIRRPPGAAAATSGCNMQPQSDRAPPRQPQGRNGPAAAAGWRSLSRQTQRRRPDELASEMVHGAGALQADFLAAGAPPQGGGGAGGSGRYGGLSKPLWWGG